MRECVYVCVCEKYNIKEQIYEESIPDDIMLIKYNNERNKNFIHFYVS